MSNPDLLGSLLKNVSRSFYLTLRVLPPGLREPIGLAYLLARAADTIADTALIPPARRLDLLLQLRARVNGEPGGASAPETIAAELSAHQSNPHEQKLLRVLGQACALLDDAAEDDRREVRRVVTTLTRGMEFDLRRFPNEASGELGALATCAELEEYTYLVAGCVGEFWTVMTCAKERALKSWDVAAMSATGIRFGKALQYTNILRDVPKDLRIGRCYFPIELLARHGLQPGDLMHPENSARARPALRELIAKALEHYEQAQEYALAIPAPCVRLRLACLWPILIGLPTLKALGQNARWLDPASTSKISRGQVQRILALSLPASGSDTLLKLWIGRETAAVRRNYEL